MGRGLDTLFHAAGQRGSDSTRMLHAQYGALHVWYCECPGYNRAHARISGIPTALWAGGYGGRDPPVPISNTAVKPPSADGTRGVTPWKSRSLPVPLLLPLHSLQGVLFLACGIDEV